MYQQQFTVFSSYNDVLIIIGVHFSPTYIIVLRYMCEKMKKKLMSVMETRAQT